MRPLLLILLTACGSSAAPPSTPAAAPAEVAPAPAEPPAPATADAPGASMPDLDLTRLDGSTLDPALIDGKAVLYVNVASRCGFTPQYEGLQALHDRYAERGLTVVGVPCNQFGGQEPGSAEQIASFCRANYGVEFPILAKQDVNGDDRSPLYAWLVHSEAGGGKDIGWNFEKFLVDREGNVINRWSSRVEPLDESVTTAIEAAL